MSLILDHLDRDRRQFHDLKPRRLRVGRPPSPRHRRAATFARHRYKRLGPRHPFGGQKLLEMGRMPRLAAPLKFGLLLDDRRLRPDRIGGRRRRRIAGVGVQTRFHCGQTPLQLGDLRVASLATGAGRFVHPAMLQNHDPRSCTLFPKMAMNGYKTCFRKNCLGSDSTPFGPKRNHVAKNSLNSTRRGFVIGFVRRRTLKILRRSRWSSASWTNSSNVASLLLPPRRYDWTRGPKEPTKARAIRDVYSFSNSVWERPVFETPFRL